MNLQKRECNIKISLTPCDVDFLSVHWQIEGDKHYFLPSGVMGSQFSEFLSAVYGLYEEDDRSHFLRHKYSEKFKHEYTSDGKHRFETNVWWDEEGMIHRIFFSRTSCSDQTPDLNNPDPVHITIKSGGCINEYTVEGRDLCYAVAKACTDALKKYGFKGYTLSTGSQYLGDEFNIDELLFVKAYALDAMAARNIREQWAQPDGWMRADTSDFEKELELLLFDM